MDRGKAARFFRGDQFYGMLFAAPTMLGFLFFALGPMVYSFFISLTDRTIFSGGNFVGFDNYLNMFSGKDTYFYQSLKVTGYYVFLSVPVAIVFSFAVALLLNQIGRGKSVIRTIFYLPSIVPIVAMASIWTWIFNVDMGLANHLLRLLGLKKAMWLASEQTVIPTMVFINLWTTGSTMVIFLAGLQDVPRQLHEAIEIDGGNAWHKLWHVTVPMMTPTIFFNLVMGFITGFQTFTQAYMMTGGGPNNASLLYVYYMYREAFLFTRMGSASAIAWVLFIIIMILSVFIFKSSSKWVYYGGGEA